MKKTFVLLVLGMFLISMGMGLVSAEGAIDDVKGVWDDLSKEILAPILKFVTGDPGIGINTNLFAKALFLLIIFSVVWISLNGVSFFNGNEWALWVVSGAVSILSVRWFGSKEVVQSVLLPYSALGIAITAAIPFFIAFVIIYEKINTRTGRKIAWAFFAVIFIGLYFSRDDVTGNWRYIYLVTALASLVLLYMDGTIQRWREKMKKEKVMNFKDMEHQNRIMKDLEKAKELKIDLISQGADQKRLKAVDEHIEKINKELEKI